ALNGEIFDANGNLRPVSEVLVDVAEGMRNADSDATRLFRSMELFGDQGARLLPLLTQGADGIARLRQEARDLGGVLSADAVASALEFDSSLKQTQFALRGISNVILSEALPHVERWTERLAGAARGSSDFASAVQTGFRIVS